MFRGVRACDDRGVNQRLTLRRPSTAGPGYSGRWVAGVAAGLAAHMGVPVWLVRLAFLILVWFAGAGVVAYVFWWVTVPAGVPAVAADTVPTERRRLAPRLTTDANADAGAAERAASLVERVRLSGPVSRLAVRDIWIGVVLLSSAALLIALRADWDPVASWVLPALIGLGGVALAWSQIDVTERDRWVGGSSTGLRSRTALLRLAGGVVLTMLGVLMLVGQDTPASVLMQAAIASVAMVAGIALVSLPWWFRLVRQLGDERAAHAREAERADIAAHLHDSVLQTLALIQKSSHDATTVARLARAQERDLRSWLYAEESTDESSLAGALRSAAAEIEDDHGVTVDVVAVGDCDLDESLRPVVQATREAVTNAAKHAGTGRVDVYAEVTPGAVDVFVRDRGAGFVLDDVPEDRYGVRRSILDRMERHGGNAEVRSAPGEGTEIRLHLPRLRPHSEENP